MEFAVGHQSPVRGEDGLPVRPGQIRVAVDDVLRGGEGRRVGTLEGQAVPKPPPVRRDRTLRMPDATGSVEVDGGERPRLCVKGLQERQPHHHHSASGDDVLGSQVRKRKFLLRGIRLPHIAAAEESAGFLN
ncbi:hypothetical protein ACFTWS_33425 [Streptomyces sp. NPDC057027]|uniref:hypothetical protein n=1 Tax=Streptomyces sp. NPDC057027 TaxID=3346004 RepID=UPI00362A01A1